MSSLINTRIQDTYTGLIKTADNLPVDGTLKNLEDGNGGVLPMQVSTTGVNFTGTVTGLPVVEAGLVNGTGTDSLKQADALVTDAATASGPQSIALGNGAVANSNQSIAIGNFSESTSVGTAAVGEYASATGIYASAWGRTSYARSDGSVAFGQQAGVPFSPTGTEYAGAVAMGRGVVADLADTTHVRALKIVAPDGGTGGNGITLLSPNGTAGEVTLTDASELAIDGTPIGGGGGGGSDLAEGQAITPYLSNNVYSIPWILSGYSQTNAKAFDTPNNVQLIPFYANPGESIGEFYFRITYAGAGALMNVGLYKSYVSTGGGYKTTMPEFVTTIASDVDVSTTGQKLFTGLDITLPTDAVGGCYWLAFQSTSTAVALTRWSNWVAAERVIYNDIYRGNGIEIGRPDFTLPTGQVDLSAMSTSASTDLSVDFAWRYKA
jgi:hypothetical protein